MPAETDSPSTASNVQTASQVTSSTQTPAQIAANEARRKAALSQTRGTGGRFTRDTPLRPGLSKVKLGDDATYKLVKDNSDKPMIDLKVTNPVTTLKQWWKRVMANEGVDLKIRIHPITALGIAAVIATGGFVVGRITIPEPFARYVPQLGPVVTPTPNPLRESAYTGYVRYSTVTQKYYLQTTSSSEAITLDVPKTVNLSGLVGRRIFATGTYNSKSRILTVSDASDLEVLPAKVTPIPTAPEVSPTLHPTPTPVPPTPSDTPVPTPTGL